MLVHQSRRDYFVTSKAFKLLRWRRIGHLFERITQRRLESRAEKNNLLAAKAGSRKNKPCNDTVTTLITISGMRRKSLKFFYA